MHKFHNYRTWLCNRNKSVKQQKKKELETAFVDQNISVYKKMKMGAQLILLKVMVLKSITLFEIHHII